VSGSRWRGVVYKARPAKLYRLVWLEKSMTDRTALIEGVRVPRFLYGPAV
jgi:hypothetical protein